ncbi:DUF2059 domain-containing protein [Pontibacter cellulosilyticus]|uniref:DUF2059 domain-containing protein n=1 Tax=Pontibacter cellulosilyticus TaxID=1720253 RepID=A0A923N6S3_9BACT|nr:DUF2059 domain-containing protein [Pontibacter cellulosilyticus]MBC5992834.1 DUF2059 domain-containing protein [Pontibacter cellulosilyticus]
MKQLYTLLIVLLISCTSAFAQDNAKTKDIRELLRVTKAGELGLSAIKTNLDAMRKTNNTLPAEVWDEFEKAFTVEDIVNLTVPVYDKHFTHQEIKDLIALYSTPLGKKLLEKTPLIMQESMVKGQQYGQEVAMRVIQRMQAEGKLPNK